MTGKEEYELKKMQKIGKLLKRNEPFLTAYHNSIIDKSFDTRYEYLLCVVRFLNFIQKDLTQLTMNDFSLYISELYINKNKGIVKEYAAMRTFGRFLYATKYLQDDPTIYLKCPKYIETKETIDKREKGFLDKREIDHVKDNIIHGVGNNYARGRQEPYKNRDMLIIMIFLSTGMRCSAMMKLDIVDINMETLQLSVYDKGGKINYHKITRTTKEYLDAWLKDREQILRGEHQDALFISRIRKRMSQRAIAEIVGKYASDIKDKRITPHKLRATYGTNIYNETGDIFFTQQCMNHNSTQVTKRYIRGNKQQNIDKSARIMAAIID